MADAGTPGADGLEKAKEAVTELVQESVVEESGSGVGEHQVLYDTKARRGKPRVGTFGVRQSWTECVGEEHERG